MIKSIGLRLFFLLERLLCLFGKVEFDVRIRLHHGSLDVLIVVGFHVVVLFQLRILMAYDLVVINALKLLLSYKLLRYLIVIAWHGSLTLLLLPLLLNYGFLQLLVLKLDLRLLRVLGWLLLLYQLELHEGLRVGLQVPDHMLFQQQVICGC